MHFSNVKKTTVELDLFTCLFSHLGIHITVSLNLGKALPLYEKEFRFRYEGMVKRNK